MTSANGSERRSDIAMVEHPPARSDALQRATPATAELPDQVARIWDRLELRDRSMVVCLEAIVRSVRVDGTASVEEVVDRYVTAQSRVDLNPEYATRAASDATSAQELKAELLESVLPRLVHSEVVAIPAGGLGAPDAVIQIANPWLRLALLESGLIQLDPHAEAATREKGMVRVSAATGKGIATPDSDWAQVWFAMMRFDWTTLAVVPASPRDGGLATAAALVEAGQRYAEGTVHLVDATAAAPHAVDLIIASMSGTIAHGTKLIVALDNPLVNPTSIPIARAADASLLGVRLGGPSLRETQRTVDSIGRDYFIGSVAIRTEK